MAKAKVTDTPKQEQTAIVPIVNQMGLVAAPDAALGFEGVDASDILISKVLLMQGLSNYVAEGKARTGELVDSLTGEVLAGVGAPFEFIPISSFKTWVEMEFVKPAKGDGKFEYVKQFPVTFENANLPMEQEIDGRKIRNDLCLNFYVLPVKEIEEMGAAAFPKLLTFRRTSYTAGKTLVSFAMRLKRAQLSLWSKSFKLTSAIKENDLGKFNIMNISMGADSSADARAVAYDWYKQIAASASKIKVDDSDLKKGEVAESPTPAHQSDIEY